MKPGTIKITGLVVAACLPLAIVLLHALPGAAATNYNNLISDAVLDNKSTMSAAQIDTFLNSFSNSCISSNHGFRAPNPTGYTPSGGFTYGSNVTAGKVLYDAAQAYDLNPQVLLATLQKEQSLVTGDAGCSTLAYTAALGYGCPDGGSGYNYSNINLYTLNGHRVTSVHGTCVNSAQKAGFSQQIIHAAWLLKFDRERAEGNVTWAIIKSHWDNSDDLDTTYTGYMTQGTHQRCSSCASTFYDGYATIDGSSIHMDNGATAALYDYTPHKSGNDHFVTIFTSWFGSTQYKYAAEIVSNIAYTDSARTTTASSPLTRKSGQTLYFTVTVKNAGSSTWSQSFAKVGTAGPRNRTSVFHDSSWPETTRPAHMIESSVAPGQNATFQFSMTAPTTDGVYTERFQMVAENLAWMVDGEFSEVITVSNRYNGAVTQIVAYSDSGHTQQTDPQTATPGQSLYLRARVKNIGTQTWSNSSTKLATTNPHDHTSVFHDSSWPGTNRLAAMTEASTAPGATGTFDFVLTAPTTTGTYTEDFGFVADGQTDGWMPKPVITPSVRVVTPPLDTVYSGTTLYPGESRTSKNSAYTLTLQHDDNIVIYANGKGAIWATHTNGEHIANLAMQNDGNLVAYNTSGHAVWSSATFKHGPSNLIMQNDGNLVIFDTNGRSLWRSGTNHNIGNTPTTLDAGSWMHAGKMLLSSNGQYQLKMQTDGNLVIYSPKRAIWATHTTRAGATDLIMQTGGNLVVYGHGKTFWSSGTNRKGTSHLIMQADGNLVLYDSHGHATWSSKTHGVE